LFELKPAGRTPLAVEVACVAVFDADLDTAIDVEVGEVVKELVVDS
jgi:hypothetical protein